MSLLVVAVFTVLHYLWCMLIGLPVIASPVRVCDPYQRVFLLAVPFSGARETTGSIIWRYALKHDLSTVLTTAGEVISQLDPDPEAQNAFSRPYHTAVTELVYNPTILGRILRVDTPYIAALSHPLAHLQSVLQNTNTTDGRSGAINVNDFLENPDRFEKQFAQRISLTNNPYARFFGMSPDYFHNDFMINELISTIDRDFSAVLILEKLDESLVMFKRAMCWSVKDIVYNLDYQMDGFPDVTQRKDIIAKHRAWAEADYAIYEHFKNKLDEYVVKGGEPSAIELSKFRQTLTMVNSFCGQVLRENDLLKVESNDWSGNFTFSVTDCKLFVARGVTLRNILATRQVGE